MNAKNCVACHKLIAETFAKCTYCGTAQPAVSAPPPKETRCATCKRAYSAKLASCPYCARGMSVPPTVAVVSGRPGAPPGTSLAPPLPPALRADADDSPILGSVVLFGAPLLVGAVCGAWQWATTSRLVEGDGLGLNGPSAGLALVLAPLLAFAFVRRCHGGIADAVAALGIPKLGAQIAGAAAIAFLPLALALSGVLGWYNAIGATERAEDLRCTVTSAFHETRGNQDRGWHIEFVCDGKSVEHLPGTFERPTAGLEAGATFKVKASPGQLGWWLRNGEPVPDGVARP